MTTSSKIIKFLTIFWVLGFAASPAQSQAEISEQEMTGMISSPDGMCDLSPTVPVSVTYDVSMRMSEAEALRHEEHDHEHDWDEQGIALAQNLKKAAHSYEVAVTNCMISEGIMQPDIVDTFGRLKCMCAPEDMLRDLRRAYDKAIVLYPEWKGTILKIPMETGGYFFLPLVSYDPETLGLRCAAYVSD